MHHSIRNALDAKESTSLVELDAAIFAAGKFAGESETFSVNVCHKISDMVGGHSTSLDMKIKLISVFQVCSSHIILESVSVNVLYMQFYYLSISHIVSF